MVLQEEQGCMENTLAISSRSQGGKHGLGKDLQALGKTYFDSREMQASLGNWCLFPFSRQQGSGRGDAEDGPVSGSMIEGAEQYHKGCAFSVKYHLVALSLGEAHAHLCLTACFPFFDVSKGNSQAVNLC